MNLINQYYFSSVIALSACLLALLSSLTLDYDILFRFVDESRFITNLKRSNLIIALP